MIERKTVLDQVELGCSGILGVKIAFLLVEGDSELDRKWHRTQIPADADPDSHMQAINNYLASMDPAMPQMSMSDIEFVAACHSLLGQRII